MWNHLHGVAPRHGIKDYDIVYFDAEELSEPAEKAVEAEVTMTFVDEPVYRAKAERWCRTWPRVTALPWPSS